MESLINRVPSFTLFTDGRLISEAPAPAIFPGPVITPTQQTRIDEQTMTDILELIEAIGFPGITEIRNRDAADFVADAADTVVRYFDANGEHYFSVYALGLGVLPGDSSRTPPQEVVDLHRLVETLSSAAHSLASDPYQPTALQLVLLDPERSFVDPQFANTIDWPFGDLTIGDFVSTGLVGCVTIDGEAAAAATVTALSEANSVTTYLLDGEEHRVLVRPLLPGEAACAILEQ